MAAGDVALNIIVSATTGAAMSGLQGVGKAISDMAGGGIMGKLAEGAIAVGVGIASIGMESVKAAGSFQQSMTLLVTSAGESKSAIALVSAGILKMSIDTATSTQQLGAGMYYIESAGYHGAAGLNVLKTAAMGAKTENADLDTVAKALTTVMVDYGMKSTDSAKAMNGLIATVQNGKTNLQELASSMGNVLPIASAMHISFPQVAGAMAVMTNAGMSARQSAQNLAHVLVALQSPSGIAVGAMKDVGLSAQQVRDSLVNQGLPQALQLIEDHVGKKFPADSVEYQTALKNILGGMVGLKLAAMLTGPSLKTTEDNITKITAAMRDGSGAVMGWADIQGNFNFKIDQAKEALNVFMISLGTRLLPVIGQIVGAITPLLSVFAEWISKTDLLGNASKMFDSILSLSGVNLLQLTHATRFLFTDGLQPLGDMIKKVAGFIGQILVGAFHVLIPLVGMFTTSVLPDIISAFNLLYVDLDKIATGIINFFTKTKQGSAIMQASATVMGLALKGVLTIIDLLAVGSEQVIIGIGNMVNFFKQNQLAALALLIPLGALSALLVSMAVTAIVAFVASIPAVIAGFVAWTVAAGTAAVATIAATWPILAIGAVIGLVVAGIILAVQHWGAISAWLTGAWSNVVGFFQNIWTKITGFFGGIGKWFTDRFNEAKNGVQSTWANVGTWFGDRWKNISDTARSGAKNTQDTFTSVTTWSKNAWMAATAAIVNSFIWLYNHNYYFKDLCDAVVHVFTVALAWVKNAWTSTINWLSNAWANIAHVATVAWNAVGTALTIATTTISNALQVAWTKSTTWLVLQWDNLKDFAVAAWKRVGEVFSSIWITYIVHPLTTLWTNISSWWVKTTTDTSTNAKNLWSQISQVFSTAWTSYIVKPLTSLWNNVSQWFSTLATNFGAWAGNALTMFTNGITNGAKNVLTAITNLGTNIAKILGFHSPPASGPLASSDQWMPNMVTMMANGVTASAPKVTNSVNTMATGINNQFSGMNSQVSNSVNNLNNTVTTGFQKMSSNVQSSTQNINSSMSGLQTSIGNQSNSINTAITNMSKNAKDGLTNINSQVQSTAMTVPKAMTTVVSSVQQSGPTVTGVTTKLVEDFVHMQKSVDTSSQQVISSTKTMSVEASAQIETITPAMKDVNKAVSDGAKQANTTQETLLGNLKNSYDKMGKMSDDFKQKTDTFSKAVVDSVDHAATALASKIGDMVKQTEQAARSVAASIASMLGHSKPTTGPLKDDDMWGEHFMRNIIGGIHKGMPELAAISSTIVATLTTIASPLLSGIKIPLLTAMPHMQASNFSEGIGSKITVPQDRDHDRDHDRRRDPDWRQDMTHITIHLDSKVIADATLPRIAKEIRIQGGVRKL